jgi:hypothetical protein
MPRFLNRHCACRQDSFLAEDDEAFLNSIHELGLAELELDNITVQIGGTSRLGGLDCLPAGTGGGKYC